MLVEEVHGLVHLSQFQAVATGKMNPLQPAIPDPELGLGIAEAVGGPGQQRLVVGDGVLALAEQGPERLADAQSLPQVSMTRTEPSSTVRRISRSSGNPPLPCLCTSSTSGSRMVIPQTLAMERARRTRASRSS